MFNLFRRKTDLENLIAQDGIEHVTDRFGQVLSNKFSKREVAFQFVLEEIEGASRGNDASKIFAATSGLNPEEYYGSTSSSDDHLEEVDVHLKMLHQLSFQLMHDQELMARFRCMVDDKIMRVFRFGKYAPIADRIDSLLKSLYELLASDDSLMPVLAKGIPTPATAQPRHVHNRKKNLAAAQDLLMILADITGEDRRSLIRTALRESL